ncbi:hypothetical protein W97_02696 [Coniosporium apollinis CBS 100218]|uniref:Uncharacterized protein n=1 Tax=Coniosporium apollinis (strain CBS 100218) TaxID=1168221 RepID=R7YNM9_CONA1|nr:uncharacterized protein W97_02696 [Coniosporium apollinis CBS 100218]EON63468.1 hypothetical protein W97_02696 [Coniosporium apollinis CBS 100218]
MNYHSAYTRPSQLFYENTSPEDLRTPWTTARCNRLLRPLTSRLAALRKLRKEHNTGTTSSQSRPLNHTSALQQPVQTCTSTGRRKSGERRKGNDPDWVPFSARKKLKRKYVGRGPGAPPSEASGPKSLAEKGRLSSQPGEICVPTPLIARHERADEAGQYSDNGVSQGEMTEADRLKTSLWCMKAPNNQEPEPRGYLQNVQRVVAQPDETLLNKLFDSFSKLLVATGHTKQPIPQRQRKGAGSLLSTCLRQVPSYIALEEYWQREDSGNDRSDISMEVYQELEQLGSAPGQGWKGLKEVIRAHGVALVAEAISEGLLDETWVERFVRQCMSQRAWSESQQLIAASILVQQISQYPIHLGAEVGPFRWVHRLIREAPFSDDTERRGFLYRQLEKMLRSGQMQAEWLSTGQFQPYWTGIISDISERNDSYSYAVELLRTAVLASCRLLTHPDNGDNAYAQGTKCSSGFAAQYGWGCSSAVPSTRITAALNNTISSLMTTLATVTIASESQQGHRDNKTDNILWPLESIAIDILRRYPTILDDRSSLQRAITVLASLLLARARACTLPQPLLLANTNLIIQTMERISIDAASDTFSPLDTIPGLVCSVARCRSRPFRSDGFVELQNLVQTLTTFHDPQTSSHSKWFMRRLALDSALEYAEGTKIPEHFALARSIEQSLREVTSMPTESPFKKSGASATKGRGWRWEEGLSEWVTVTPAPTARLSARHLTALPSPVSEPERASPMVIIHRRLLGLGARDMHDTPCRRSLSSMLPNAGELDLNSSPVPTRLPPQEPRPLKRCRDVENTDETRRSKRTRATVPPQRSGDITNTFSKAEAKESSPFSSEADSDAFIPPPTRKVRRAATSIKPRLVADDEDELSMNELRSGRARSQPVIRRGPMLPKKRQCLRRSLSIMSARSEGAYANVDESEDELSFG